MLLSVLLWASLLSTLTSPVHPSASRPPKTIRIPPPEASPDCISSNPTQLPTRPPTPGGQGGWWASPRQELRRHLLGGAVDDHQVGPQAPAGGHGIFPAAQGPGEEVAASLECLPAPGAGAAQASWGRSVACHMPWLLGLPPLPQPRKPRAWPCVQLSAQSPRIPGARPQPCPALLRLAAKGSLPRLAPQLPADPGLRHLPREVWTEASCWRICSRRDRTCSPEAAAATEGFSYQSPAVRPAEGPLWVSSVGLTVTTGARLAGQQLSLRGFQHCYRA